MRDFSVSDDNMCERILSQMTSSPPFKADPQEVSLSQMTYKQRVQMLLEPSQGRRCTVSILSSETEDFILRKFEQSFCAWTSCRQRSAARWFSNVVI
jgi:hypothetical protein